MKRIGCMFVILGALSYVIPLAFIVIKDILRTWGKVRLILGQITKFEEYLPLLLFKSNAMTRYKKPTHRLTITHVHSIRRIQVSLTHIGNLVLSMLHGVCTTQMGLTFSLALCHTSFLSIFPLPASPLMSLHEEHLINTPFRYIWETCGEQLGIQRFLIW